MDADLRITGEEMDGELETGFGRDLIIRRMIGELPTWTGDGDVEKDPEFWSYLCFAKKKWTVPSRVDRPAKKNIILDVTSFSKFR